MNLRPSGYEVCPESAMGSNPYNNCCFATKNSSISRKMSNAFYKVFPRLGHGLGQNLKQRKKGESQTVTIPSAELDPAHR